MVWQSSTNWASAIVADKLFTDDEGLCKSVGGWLFRIFETHTEVGAVAKQSLEARQVVRRGDDQDLTDACEHQRGDRVVDHGFVENGDQLLANAFGDGVEAGA